MDHVIVGLPSEVSSGDNHTDAQALIPATVSDVRFCTQSIQLLKAGDGLLALRARGS
jgi:hypothetical protein